MLSKRQKTHGASKGTKLYGVWCSIKSRCYNKNTAAYKDYGGRGIEMCKEWKDNFEPFMLWAMENGYEDGLSIDRVNNDFGYCPNNCRWVTDAAQASNRRSNRNYTINGETHCLTEWARLNGINPKTLFTRVYSGCNFEEALRK